MLKKPLSVIISDEQIESVIIDNVIVNAVDGATGLDVDEMFKVRVNRHHYSWYVGWSGNDPEQNAVTFIRNIADEAELHGLHFDRLVHPNLIDIDAEFRVVGRLS